LGVAGRDDVVEVNPLKNHRTVYQVRLTLHDSVRSHSASVHDLLFFAVKNKRLISFTYQGYLRVAEPHDYGMLNKVRALLVYQVRGESKTGGVPGWKHIRESGIRGLQILDEPFPGGRAVPSGQHKKWDKVFIRVAPA
jgi:hypothetical protein